MITINIACRSSKGSARLRWFLSALLSGLFSMAGHAQTPFEPITLQRIDLPASMVDASTPAWTLDGHHLLFSSTGGTAKGHLYIVAEDGAGLHCLSCGLANEPVVTPSEQEAMAYPFPDGKRAFFGPYGTFSVLECAPSLINCLSAQILPIDLSAARATTLPIVSLGGGAAPHLAPDGVHLAFSDIRSDAVELMVIGSLVRQASKYVLANPRVINPLGPTGPNDTNPIAWSNAGDLYEFKSFADGGASATYVAEPDSGNPDVIKVNLATGQTTRLTTHPDWDEDNAPSPDGNSIVVESDRSMHRVDMFNLMPVRSFVDTPMVSAEADYFVPSATARQCDLQPWLLPIKGDSGGMLMGQPINPYTGGDVHAANNVSGTAQWSPDGTKIALNLESFSTALSPSYLLIAHLTARSPTLPLPVVNSEPGPWALSPVAYHGMIQTSQSATVKGLASGSAHISFWGWGGFAGIDSVVYNHYSDDGKSFVDGNTTVTNALMMSMISTGTVRIQKNLLMSGAHTGSTISDITFNVTGVNPTSATTTGSTTSTLDGVTLSGPPAVPKACPADLPKPPQTSVSATIAAGKVAVNVFATVGSAGPTENYLDVRPVWGATVSMNGQSVLTDVNGNATLIKPSAGHSATINVKAGDTLLPAYTVINF